MTVLVIKPEDVARRLGVEQPLDERDRWLIEQAIADAQSDLEAYLGRSVTPTTYTESGLWRSYDGRYTLTYWPLIAIVSATAETHPESGQPTGYYTVMYTAGLDARTDPELAPIRRLVMLHALYSPMVQALYRRLAPTEARRIDSLNVEGQGVTYEDTYAVDAKATELGLPGALPSFKTCDRWRLAGRRVVQGRTRVDGPWPYEYASYESTFYGEW